MTVKHAIPRLFAYAALASMAAASGCGDPTLNVSGGQAALPADEGSPGFLDRVASGPTVSENDAFRGVLMLIEGDDPAETFQQRVRTLAESGVVDSTWSFDADRPMTKGKLAYMICQACDIRGGVILHATGPSQRYCLRELQYLRMMSAGPPYAEVTGMEYVAVLTRADTYRRKQDIPVIMETKAGGE